MGVRIMKFYEFNKFEYYGLVLAIDQEWAKKGYKEIVADIDGEDKEISPDVITQDEALKKYKRGDIDGCDTEQEKEEDFYRVINNFKDYVSDSNYKYMVLLIDGSLL